MFCDFPQVCLFIHFKKMWMLKKMWKPKKAFYTNTNNTTVQKKIFVGNKLFKFKRYLYKNQHIIISVAVYKVKIWDFL